uniref:Uncharacterized protein n=1 Tax=Arundo donax TaxID=35708 RepID=A0A0A9ANN9_ARUDO
METMLLQHGGGLLVTVQVPLRHSQANMQAVLMNSEQTAMAGRVVSWLLVSCD